MALGQPSMWFAQSAEQRWHRWSVVLEGCSKRDQSTFVVNRRLSSYRLYSTFSNEETCKSSRSTILKQLFHKETKEPDTIYQTLLTSIQILQDLDAPEPIDSACHLLSHALKGDFRWEDNGFATLLQMMGHSSQGSSFQYSNPSTGDKVDFFRKLVPRNELEDFADMLYRRIKKEPLQYIIGQWDFYNCTLKIRSPCLCPRPETEELVEHVVQDIRQVMARRRLQTTKSGSSRHNERKIRILDCGCGTGAIGISIAKLFPNDVEVVAIDINPEAVTLSRENAAWVLGEGMVASLYQAFESSASEYTNEEEQDCNRPKYDFKFDIVVSNPPYIPLADMSTLTDDVIGHEDYNALCGGVDGMDVIRDIVARLPEWSKKEDQSNEDNGLPPVCWMEVDTSHPVLMEEWLRDYVLKCNVKFVEGRKDLSGFDRFVKLEVLPN